MIRRLVLSMLFLATPVLAQAPALTVTRAEILGGVLIVVGTTAPNIAVGLDEVAYKLSDDRGRFDFRLVYFPTNCIVRVWTPTTEPERFVYVVVARCGNSRTIDTVVLEPIQIAPDQVLPPITPDPPPPPPPPPPPSSVEPPGRDHPGQGACPPGNPDHPKCD